LQFVINYEKISCTKHFVNQVIAYDVADSIEPYLFLTAEHTKTLPCNEEDLSGELPDFQADL